MSEGYKAPCPYHRQCGGCQLQNLPYGQQLEYKQGQSIRILGKFGHVENIIGMESPEHYRNKVHASLGLDRRGRPVCGIYQPGSHAIVPVDSCLIEDETAHRIIQTIWKMLPEFKIQVYDELRGGGWLRHVLVKRGFATGELMVVLVAVNPIFKLQKPFLKKLLEKHPEISTVVLNVNDRFGPVVLGKREKVIYGSGYIEDLLLGRRFRISPASFYQINPVQTEKLYSVALDFAGLKGKETVLDAYCGIGTIGLCASGKAKQVIGVEINRDAVKDAIANARLNGIKNCWFTAGDAGEYMESLAADGQQMDTVFMDPPRSGSDERFIASLLKSAPGKIVYISCNIETQARDLELLCAGGYRVEKLQPVDMFPFTKHIECVALLTRLPFTQSKNHRQGAGYR